MTEGQGGFRSHRRCSNHWLALKGVCELWKREKKTSYLAFLDVSKAYDSVLREGLWCKMRNYCVEDKCVKSCGVEMRVVMNGAKSRWFGIERGLRQGCPLSPLLFNIMGMLEDLEGTRGVS